MKPGREFRVRCRRTPSSRRELKGNKERSPPNLQLKILSMALSLALCFLRRERFYLLMMEAKTIYR
jgi:hypothetical protein